MADPPPPPPPPHGQNPRPPGGLPDGNYDIFIIPPHSAGGGFLYLPSMQPHRNSFLLGVACTLLAVGVWTLAMPVLKQWTALLVQSGGIGVILLIVGVGVAGWAWGKTQGESNNGPRPAPGSGGPHGTGANTGSQWGQSRDNPDSPPSSSWGPPPQPPPPRPPPQSAGSKPFGASSGWEKAKEETKKREEERKRAEELKKKAEEIRRAKEEAERTAKAKAEKEKWEQARAREKDQREREARERIAKERQEKAASAKSKYEKATARSAAGTETAYSYRPYDTPPKQSTHKSTASSVSGVSESSYAPSHSTARTTPPPSHRGPYSTDDPDKIQIKAVYLFSDSFPVKPQSQLIANQGSVTDGLILRIKTEGLFIDDDIRGVPQREWDVKAWTLKLVEDGMTKTSTGQSLHVLRATNRDSENKKYTFVLDEREGFKVAIGLAKLRKGSQVRSLGMNGMKEAEVRGLLTSLGWM